MPPTLRCRGRLGNPSGGVGESGFRLREIRLAQRKMRVEFCRRFQDALFADSIVEDRRQLGIATLNVPIVANRRAGEDDIEQHRRSDNLVWDAVCRQRVRHRRHQPLAIGVQCFIGVRPAQDFQRLQPGDRCQGIAAERPDLEGEPFGADSRLVEMAHDILAPGNRRKGRPPPMIFPSVHRSGTTP